MVVDCVNEFSGFTQLDDASLWSQNPGTYLTIFLTRSSWINGKGWNTIFVTLKQCWYDWSPRACSPLSSTVVTQSTSHVRCYFQGMQFRTFFNWASVVSVFALYYEPVCSQTPHSIFNCVWPAATTCCNGGLQNWEETRSRNTGN